jgi:hypothetical protein
VSVPLVFCIDLEPDERLGEIRRCCDWLGFDATFAILSRWRTAFEERTGRPARFSWFVRLDPQIARLYDNAAWPLERYSMYFDEILDRGDVVGLHTHAFRWLEKERMWVTDHGDQAWIEECLEMSFDTYRKHLGSRCETFRFGDRFTNTDTINTLEHLGVRVDLTPEPLHPACRGLAPSEVSKGTIPSYESLVHAPYVPSREDFLKSSAEPRSIAILPMSSGHLPPEKAPRFARPGRSRLPTPVETLNLARPHERIANVARHLLSTLPKPYLATVVRSSTAGVTEKRRQLERSLAHLLDLAREQDLTMMSPQEAIRHLM